MADTPADTQDTDDTNALALELPRRPDVAGRWAPGVAAQVEALDAEALAAAGDDTLLRAGALLLEGGHADLAARCFTALEGRESVEGPARLGLAWVSWAKGEADACAEGLGAAAQLDASLALVPEGAELTAVRTRAGGLTVLAAKDDEGEHDVERLALSRPLTEDERTALTSAAEALAGLDAAAVAGYGALALTDDTATLRRAAVSGRALSAALGDAGRSLDDALALVTPLAEGLAAAHAKGLVHGDVRAELVTETDDGPVLRGFGLAGLQAPSMHAVALGTVAPERLGGAAATAKSDAYGLAALLYRVLTARDPVGSVLRPSDLELDARLDDLFTWALHPDASARLEVSMILEQLREIATTDADAPQPVTRQLSVPIVLPDDPDDLDAWLGILERKPTHQQAREAITRIEAEAREGQQWDRVAEVLGARAHLAEVQQDRVALRRELVQLYETQLQAPGSAFKEVQTLIEEVPVAEQVATVGELSRLAEITGQWGPLAESLEIVADRATVPADRARLYTQLGRVLADHQGSADRGLAAFEKAIEIEASAESLAAAVPLYRKSGQVAELVGTLLNLADHQEGADKAQTLRDAATVLHDDLEDVEGAFATLRAALEEEPGHAEALATAESFARELEDWDSLVELLDQRAEAASDAETIRELRTEAASLAAEQLQNPTLAVEQLEKLLAREPEHEPTARTRVELLRGMAEADEAHRPALIKALEVLVPLVERTGAQLALMAELAELLDAEPEGKAQAAQTRQQLVETQSFALDVVRDAAEALERWYRREENVDSLLGLLRRAGESKDAPTTMRVDAWKKVLELVQQGGAAPDPDASLAALEALADLDPDDHTWRDTLVETYVAREEFEKAGPLIRQQVSDEGIDPKRKAALLWQGGQLRAQIGKVEGAVEAIEEAVQLDPSLYDAWLALRDLYRQREQPLKAIEAQVEAARNHPTRSEKVALTFEAAKTYLETLGQPDKGMSLLEELVEIDPDHREASGMLVERLVAAGDLTRAWPVAQTWVAQLAAQTPDDRAANLRALSIAGRCAVAAEEPERAREYLQKARSLDATNLDVLRLLGEMDMEAERWEEALKSYQSVVLGAGDKLPPPELAQVYLSMAQARLGMNERPKSIQLVERALDIDPQSQAAMEKLVELAETPADSVKAKQRQAQMMARREETLSGDEQAQQNAQRMALLQEIAKIQAEQLESPEDAARTLEPILASSPEDPATLHGLMDAFTKAGRWRDVTRVIDMLAAQQPTDAMRAKYLYAGAAIFRDQLADSEGYLEWIGRVLKADPTHAKALKGYRDQLEKKGSHKDLAKHLRGQLKALPKDAPAAERVDLFTRLGEVYEQHLGDAKTALAAYSQAVRFSKGDAPDMRARRVKIMELALSMGDDELDKAIIQGHALIAADPMEFGTYHRMVELYQRRKNEDRAGVIASTLAFLKQANEAEQALAAAAAEREAQIRSTVTRELWRKTLYHAKQDARLTEIFAIVWPIVAAREDHSHAHHSVARGDRAKVSLKSSDPLARYLSYASGVFDVPAPDYFPRPKEPGGLRIDALCEGEGDAKRVFPTVLAGRDTLREDSEAGLKFRAAGAISRVRPGHILASVLPSAGSLRHVFFAAASLSGTEIPPDCGHESGRLAKHLKRFMTPAQVDQLGALSRKVLDKGDPDVKGWAQGVAYTASRAGFVLCDSIDSSARVLTAQGDEGMLVPFKDRIRDLVAYSCSTGYLKLRKELGLSR